MPQRPRPYTLALTVSLLLAGGILVRLSCGRPEPINSPEALLRRLDAAGLDYEGHFVSWRPQPTRRT